jgi:hypothetical protein
MFWTLRRFGYDRRALRVQTVSAWIVLPLSWLCGAERDINWAWGPYDRAQHALPPGVYLAICMAVYPMLIYLPSHLALVFISRRLAWGARPGSDSPV